MSIRITVDTGGTFTDVVVSDGSGKLHSGKALTTSERSFDGLWAALTAAAEGMGADPSRLLSEAELIIFGTTRATNAIVTRNTARTALLTTEGFPDILVLKEGGKFDPHDFSQPYPEPYIPRRHAFEIRERVDAEGGVVVPLDVAHTRAALRRLATQKFEAVAVCLVWSIANPAHELLLGQLIEEELGDIPYTLSHQLIPIIREYRRASTTAIDASLKPLMRKYLAELEGDLKAAGFTGELLVSTSIGGCMHVSDIAERPIHCLKSGPAMAPVAGHYYAELEKLGADLLVCDAGGTTFDVGLVREGQLVFTRDTWLGRQWIGDLVSMSTVDVRSVGAGGGSIAWTDPGGLLRVGPHSAGSEPGPVCYGRGGTKPTVTDAAVVLGYVDPDYFVGGRMALDAGAARTAIEKLALEIQQTPEATAYGILRVANELMIRAIQEITVNEGIDPRENIIVAGGGAAGLNILPIAEELGCKQVLLPETASTLSACGMQFADIVGELSASLAVRSDNFDRHAVSGLLARLERDLAQFETASALSKGVSRVSFSVEARYEFQVWDLEVAIDRELLQSDEGVKRLFESFHTAHERVFAVRDVKSVIEFVNWKARMTAHMENPRYGVASAYPAEVHPAKHRSAYFGGLGSVSTPVYKDLHAGHAGLIEGPAIIEMPATTVVIYPGMRASVTPFGNFFLGSAAVSDATPAPAMIK